MRVFLYEKYVSTFVDKGRHGHVLSFQNPFAAGTNPFNSYIVDLDEDDEIWLGNWLPVPGNNATLFTNFNLASNLRWHTSASYT